MSEELWEKYGSIKTKAKSKIELLLLEEKIGFSLPHDYKLFLLNYSAFDNFIGNQYVIIWNLEEVLEFNEDYEAFELINKGIGIGSNGSSEMIVLTCENEGDSEIYLVPYLDLDEKNTYINIGESFTDLFKRLESGQEWFN